MTFISHLHCTEDINELSHKASTELQQVVVFLNFYFAFWGGVKQ